MSRAVRAAAVAALLLALTGCVGIPTSGGVEAGPVFDEQAEPEVVVRPSDPVPGSDQERILFDFMQAVRSPRDNYAVARLFMTEDLAARWQPDAGTVVRSTATSAPSAEEADTWLYTVTTRATVNADGQYAEQPEPVGQTLRFGFAQEGGEWRISAAEDGIVLSQQSFDVAFSKRVLYFFDPSHRYLVPDVRWFPSRATTAVRVVNALLEGQSEWLQQGVLQTAFPPATVLGSERVTVSGSSATVDLSLEALAATEQEREWMRQQLAATLGTPEVSMTVVGRDLPVPDANGAIAVVDPLVDSAALVGDGTQFGLDGGAGITPIAGLSAPIIEVGATAAVLGTGRTSIAFRGGDGVVGLVTADGGLVPLDDRPALAAPALDPFGFVWSVQAASAATLSVFGPDEEPHPVQSALPADAAVVSMDVSRDGTRLMMYLSTPVGPRLLVAGIIRQDGVPTALGPFIEPPVSAAAPVDATWVDDRRVATLTADGEVTAFELGGPSLDLGQVPGGGVIAGGNNGTAGVRILAGGELWRPQGTASWVRTGIPATLLATKQ